MDDVENIRDFIIQHLAQQYDSVFAHQGLEHLIAVGQFAGILALKRNQSPILAQIAGYLHDLAFYSTHYHPQHAQKSAMMAKAVLAEHTHLSVAEKNLILTAIAAHSAKEHYDDPLSEIIKDADVLAHALTHSVEYLPLHEKKRLHDMIKKDER